MDKNGYDMDINREEVAALLSFAANNGITVPEEDSNELLVFINTSAESKDSVNNPIIRSSETYTAYTHLTKLTASVTGRSIIASCNVKVIIWPIIVITFFLIVFVLGNEIISKAAEDGDIAPDSWFDWLANFQDYVLDIKSCATDVWRYAL